MYGSDAAALNNSIFNSTTNIVLELLNTTQQAVTLTTNGTRDNGNEYSDSYTRKRYFMLMIGGWLLTAIFAFGVLFMLVTHFLGRYQWRKYQERLDQEKHDVNHIFVDPKLMRHTQKGWRQIVYDIS